MGSVSNTSTWGPQYGAVIRVGVNGYRDGFRQQHQHLENAMRVGVSGYREGFRQQHHEAVTKEGVNGPRDGFCHQHHHLGQL